MGNGLAWAARLADEVDAVAVAVASAVMMRTEPSSCRASRGRCVTVMRKVVGEALLTMARVCNLLGLLGFVRAVAIGKFRLVLALVEILNEEADYLRIVLG